MVSGMCELGSSCQLLTYRHRRDYTKHPAPPHRFHRPIRWILLTSPQPALWLRRVIRLERGRATEDKDLKKILIRDLQVDAENITDGCLELVRWACSVVAKRAATLAACAIAAVIMHTGNDKTPEGEDDTGVDVGIDGRCVERY